jgi:hypothetical protein
MGWERSTGQWRERDKGMKGVKKWMSRSVGTYNMKRVEEGRGIRMMMGWTINWNGKAEYTVREVRSERDKGKEEGIFVAICGWYTLVFHNY